MTSFHIIFVKDDFGTFLCCLCSLTVMIWALSSGERVKVFGFPLNSLWKACMALAVTSCNQEHSRQIKQQLHSSDCVDEQRAFGCNYAFSWVLTTWPSVITRSRVSQQGLTAPWGNVPTSSFRRPSMWSVVVSSLLPEGYKKNRQSQIFHLFTDKNNLSVNRVNNPGALPPAWSISLMQNLAVVTAAGWWAGAFSVNRKSLPLMMEQTPCCADLRTWRGGVDDVSILFHIEFNTCYFRGGRDWPSVCCAPWSWAGRGKPEEWMDKSTQTHPASVTDVAKHDRIYSKQETTITSLQVYPSTNQYSSSLHHGHKKRDKLVQKQIDLPIWERRPSQTWPV